MKKAYLYICTEVVLIANIFVQNFLWCSIKGGRTDFCEISWELLRITPYIAGLILVLGLYQIVKDRKLSLGLSVVLLLGVGLLFLTL